jgi:chemotaxis protein CheD
VTVPGEVRVGLAQAAAGGGDTVLRCAGLGSCVAVALWDAECRIGALAHVMLPGPELSAVGGEPGRFARTAVPHLLALLAEHGATGPVTARLVGGAAMFRALLAMNGINVGERNVLAARAALAAAGVPLVGEDVGGDYGRSVRFDVRSGRVQVRSVSAGEREL